MIESLHQLTDSELSALGAAVYIEKERRFKNSFNPNDWPNFNPYVEKKLDYVKRARSMTNRSLWECSKAADLLFERR